MRRMLGNVLGSKPAMIVLVNSGAECEKNDDSWSCQFQMGYGGGMVSSKWVMVVVWSVYNV